MSSSQPKFPKRNIYLEYHRPGRSFYDKVKYYEDHLKEINYLDFDAKIELRIDYQIALFEIGRYYRFLTQVDEILELVIRENIFEINSNDVFKDLLFKKAACQYNLGRYEESIIILKQLVNINPNNKTVRSLLKKCYRKLRSETAEHIQKLGFYLVINSIAFMMINKFKLISLRPEDLYSMNNVTPYLFFIGISILGLNELWHFYKFSKK